MTIDNEVLSGAWDVLLDDTQVDFVNAMVVTHNVSQSAAMVGVSKHIAKTYMKSPRVQAAIQIRQKQMRDDVIISPSEVITDLRIIRDMALGRIPSPKTAWVDGTPSTHYITEFNAPAAQKAVESLGKIAGLYVERKEITVPATDRQLQRRLEDLLGVSLEGEFVEVPDVTEAQKLAAEVLAEPTLPPEHPESPPLPAEAAPREPPTGAVGMTDAEVDEVFNGLMDDDLTAKLIAVCDDELGVDE